MKFRDNFPELNENQWAMLLRLLMEVAPEKRNDGNCDCTIMCDCYAFDEGVETYGNIIKALLEGKVGGYDKTQ